MSEYEEFIESFRPDLRPEMARFLADGNNPKSYLDFVHKELSGDFELFTKYKALPGVVKVRRLWTRSRTIRERFTDDHTNTLSVSFYHQRNLYLDLAVNDAGAYGILKNGKVWEDRWFDNVGLFSIWDGHWYDDFYPEFGVYVKNANTFAMLLPEKPTEYIMHKDMFPRPDGFDTISEFRKNGLPHYKGESQGNTWGRTIDWVRNERIILDDRTWLEPKFGINDRYYCGYYLTTKIGNGPADRRDFFYMGKVPDDFASDPRNKTVEAFLKLWTEADETGRAKLRDGLGYSI